MPPFSSSPCAAFSLALLIVFSYLAYSRYLRYRERLALAEKGLSLPEHKPQPGAAPRWGVLVSVVGVALLLGLLPLALQRAWIWLFFALLPLFIGASLLLIYVLTRHDPA
jgi:hypothetical protein